MADDLWFPFIYAAASPKGAFLFTLIVYLLFLLIWAPLRLLSFVITPYGTYLALAASVFALGRLIALYLSYPGAFKTTQVFAVRVLLFCVCFLH
jgi:hypothetical protein